MRIIRYLCEDGTIRFAEEKAPGSHFDISGDIFGDFEVTDHPSRVVKALAPVEPPVILCIGHNYRKHVEETGAKMPQYPVLFLKSLATVQNPGDPIILPTRLRSNEVDYECELAVVIGRKCKNVSKREALDVVLGYTAGNDVSARDWQRRFGGGQFCKGKSFDTFAPLGPVLVTKEDIPDPNALQIATRVNGETRQSSSTADMIFDVRTLIEFLSGSTTLYPGSVILTGTPSGVGMAMNPPRYLAPGDVVEIEIEKIGVLTNPVVPED
ncbi:MAG: fumarylacetoacetate hydrolase family protein [Verrucomicrobia bacterium]|nr:fumarylacetoacetate hydrolase family protein [Verrucomicrobiota bacterium]